MSLINFNEYFDFDGYKAAIKELTGVNKEFAASVSGYVKTIGTSLAESKGELQQFATSFQQFNVNTKNAATNLATMTVESEKATARYKDQRAAIEGLLQVQDLSTRSVNELKAGVKELKIQYDALSGASADVRAKKAALASEAQRLTDAIKLETAAFKGVTKEVTAAAGSYDALQQEFTQVGRSLKEMSNAFDPVTGKINEQNTAAVALQARYIGLSGTLKNIDAGLGNFQRNIGNYKSGFSGLGNSINQITREFPAFANSVQTGFLAISNNLPIFFDEIQKTQKGIAALKAEGKEAPTLFKALATSVLSFGTALSLGVTLLTLYGKDIVEFFGTVFAGSKKFKEAEEAIKSYAEAFKSTEYKNAVSNVTDLTAAVDLAKKGFISKTDVINKYNETVGKTTGVVTTLAGVEQQLAEKGDAYIRFTLLKAQATALLGKAAEAAANAQIKATSGFSFGNFVSATLKGGAQFVGQEFKAGVDAAEKEAKGFEDLFKKVNEQATKFAKDNGLNILGNSKIDKGAENKALNDYKKGLDEREKLLKETFDAEVLAAQRMLDERRIDQVGFEITRYNSAVKYTKAAAEEENKANTVGFKARKDKLKEFDNFRTEAENKRLKASRDANDQALKDDLIEQQKTIEEITALQLISVKDGQAYELAVKNRTNEERVKLEIDFQNQIDEITIKSLQDRAALEIDSEKRTLFNKQASGLRRGITNRNAFGANVSIPAARGADTIQDLQIELNTRKLFNTLTVAEELATAIKIREIHASLNEDTKADDAKILELRKKQQDETISYLKASAQAAGLILGQGLTTVFDDILNGFTRLANGGKLTFDDLAKFGIDSANAITESYKSNIDQQMQALEVQRNQELKLAGRNASAQAAINIKFDREQAALNLKKAKADRENAVFQIAINTSQAVLKAIAESPLTFGLPWSAYALGAGALQTALVLSRPLPKFEKGREGGPETFAIVDEKGPELIIDRHGRLKEIGGSGPRVTKLNSGDRVKTAMDTKRILQSLESDSILRDIQLNGRLAYSLSEGKQTAEIVKLREAFLHNGIDENKMIAGFRSAVKDIPIHQSIWDENGVRRRTIENGKTTEFLNLFSVGKKR